MGLTAPVFCSVSWACPSIVNVASSWVFLLPQFCSLQPDRISVSRSWLTCRFWYSLYPLLAQDPEIRIRQLSVAPLAFLRVKALRLETYSSVQPFFDHVPSLRCGADKLLPPQRVVRQGAEGNGVP